MLSFRFFAQKWLKVSIFAHSPTLFCVMHGYEVPPHTWTKKVWRNPIYYTDRPHILHTFSFETRTTINSDFQLLSNNKEKFDYFGYVHFWIVTQNTMIQLIYQYYHAHCTGYTNNRLQIVRYLRHISYQDVLVNIKM